MERPPVPPDARAVYEVWTTEDGFADALHVREGEVLREVVDLLRDGIAEVAAGKRSYGLDDHVWLAQFVLRGVQVGCGYGTLDADGSLLRHSLRDLTVHAGEAIDAAADRTGVRARLHVVEAVDRALERWDLVSALVAAAADRADAVRRLAAEPFRFDTVQAAHVLDLPVGRRTRASRDALRGERDALRAQLDAPS